MLPRRGFGKLLQRVVELDPIEHIDRVDGITRDVYIVKINLRTPTATLVRASLNCVIHQDSAHRQRRGIEEMRPGLKVLLATYELQISLVNQCCSLQRVIGTFAA